MALISSLSSSSVGRIRAMEAPSGSEEALRIPAPAPIPQPHPLLPRRPKTSLGPGAANLGTPNKPHLQTNHISGTGTLSIFSSPRPLLLLYLTDLLFLLRAPARRVGIDLAAAANPASQFSFSSHQNQTCLRFSFQTSPFFVSGSRGLGQLQLQQPITEILSTRYFY